ncbi:hypothetical protein IAU60_006237 [Kwoniella sp. DSM 27419]
MPGSPFHGYVRPQAPASSPEFGAFTEAGPSTSPRRSGQPSLMDDDDDDLLGSFHSPFQPLPPLSQPELIPKLQPPYHNTDPTDLLGGDTWHDATLGHTKTASGHRGTSAGIANGRPEAVHVSLPPRPTDISPDYQPPLRSPRRMSTDLFSRGGMGSPPIISDAGNEIIFHPEYKGRSEDAMADVLGLRRSTSIGHSDAQDPFYRQTLSRSPPRQSSLLQNLATTTKLASKWRSALTPSTHTPHDDKGDSQQSRQGSNRSNEMPPLDVTHVTPFASAEHVAGSYTAPSGAPGFNARERAEIRHDEKDEDWGGVLLMGRRESTMPVLTGQDATALRPHLPPRQRLSNKWTLLFSLDQHGASLNTLYRLIDKFAQSHRSSGNILVVCDGEGNRFGAYLNESIAKREGTYYGSGESFLFKLASGPQTSNVKAFNWTGRNQYFALCETSFISFGGGAGTYGLILDSTFSQNSSATCPAYDNEILSSTANRRSSKASPFECVGLEVWAT